jgi:hypothetical protein
MNDITIVNALNSNVAARAAVEAARAVAIEKQRAARAQQRAEWQARLNAATAHAEAQAAAVARLTAALALAERAATVTGRKDLVATARDNLMKARARLRTAEQARIAASNF